MNIEITSSQAFFEEKIFPNLEEVYNYELLMNGDESLSEKLLLKTCNDANWFSEYLSSETDTRIWLLRIITKKESDRNYDNDDTKDLRQTEQSIDLSKFDKDCIEHKGAFETAKQISETISKLPYSLRQVLVLVDFLRFSFEQAADLIDVPSGVVLTRLYDARKLLLFKLTSAISIDSSTVRSEITHADKKKIVSLVNEQIKTERDDNDKIKFESEIEAQQYVRNLFEKYISLQPIRPVIQKKIAGKFAPQLKSKIEEVSSPGRKGIVAAATIVMLIFAAVFILINGPGIVKPEDLANKQKGENNILVQLEKNYDLLINHGVDSLMAKIDHDSAFGNQPIILTLNGWYLSDYFVKNFDKGKLINLIYKNNSGNILYSYQVPPDLIKKANSFKLTEDLFDYLHSENCFAIKKGEITYLLKAINGSILGVAGQNLDRLLLAEICNRKPI